MSAHLEAPALAAWNSHAVDLAHSVLRADQPYAPPQPADDNDILDFFTSAQTILGIVAALIAAVLLLSLSWPSRRKGRDEGEGREEGKDQEEGREVAG
ncbi:hypothetical protein ACIBAG_07615 [Streptomyces sp. NPDC051243]|uniref:hypothetical protein n=1 Tax=Streptomyces sp. NPDC051243 TaxID=3365646 RepID=UPI003790A1BE